MKCALDDSDSISILLDEDNDLKEEITDYKQPAIKKCGFVWKHNFLN